MNDTTKNVSKNIGENASKFFKRSLGNIFWKRIEKLDESAKIPWKIPPKFVFKWIKTSRQLAKILATIGQNSCKNASKMLLKSQMAGNWDLGIKNPSGNPSYLTRFFLMDKNQPAVGQNIGNFWQQLLLKYHEKSFQNPNWSGIVENSSKNPSETKWITKRTNKTMASRLWLSLEAFVKPNNHN